MKSVVSGLLSIGSELMCLAEKGLRHRAQGIGQKPRNTVYEKLSEDSGWNQTGALHFRLSPWALRREPFHQATINQGPGSSCNGQQTTDN